MSGGFYNISDIGGSVGREDKMDIYDVKQKEYQNVAIKWTLGWEREKT